MGLLYKYIDMAKEANIEYNTVRCEFYHYTFIVLRLIQSKFKLESIYFADDMTFLPRVYDFNNDCICYVYSVRTNPSGKNIIEVDLSGDGKFVEPEDFGILDLNSLWEAINTWYENNKR